MNKKLLQVCALGVLTLLSFSAHSDDQLKPELIAGAAVSGTTTAVAGASSLRYFDKTRALMASAAVARKQKKQAQLWAEAKSAQKKVLDFLHRRPPQLCELFLWRFGLGRPSERALRRNEGRPEN